MMNEEDYLNSKMQHRNPFTVPEGYFEQLAAQVMERLPEQPANAGSDAPATTGQPARKAFIRQLRPWLYAAACLVVGVFVAAIAFMGNSNNDGAQHMQAATTDGSAPAYYSDNYIEDEANYAMVDNQEIYAYLLAEM